MDPELHKYPYEEIERINREGRAVMVGRLNGLILLTVADPNGAYSSALRKAITDFMFWYLRRLAWIDADEVMHEIRVRLSEDRRLP